MKIQTFSIVIGTPACDGGCRFCVSRTTGFEELPSPGEFNVTNFRKAVKLAQLGGCTTALLTGKGEPTLYPGEITGLLSHLKELGDPFPFVELQTNAIRIGERANGPKPMTQALITDLQVWHGLGLNTIAISTVGINPEWNKTTYLHHRDIPYPNLETTVKMLHNIGFTVRLSVMMQRGMVDSPHTINRVLHWCRDNEVAQLTIRPIRQPVKTDVTGSGPYHDWIEKNGLKEVEEDSIRDFIEQNGTHIMTLMNGGHAAKVFDVDGQNVCVSDCLTVEPAGDDIRTLVFYNSGRLTFDWQHKGARLL